MAYLAESLTQPHDGTAAEVVQFPTFKVTSRDRDNLGRHVKWAGAFVNYVRGYTPDRPALLGDVPVLTWEFSGLSVIAGAWNSNNPEGYQLHLFNYHLGVNLSLKREAPEGEDTLELGIDPYGDVRYGSYHWQGSRRPAPNAERIAGVYHAHAQRVTGQTALLLSLYKEEVLASTFPEPPDGVKELPMFVSLD